MCSALVSRGHRAEVITTTWKGRAESTITPFGDAVPITYHTASKPKSYGTSWPLAVDVKRRLTEFDVVHVHQVYFFHGLVARVNCTRQNVPTVISPHGVFDPFHRRVSRLKKAVYWSVFERHNVESAAALHYATVAEAQHAADAGLPDKAFVIPLAVPVPPISDAGALLEIHPNLVGRTLVTFLGRLTAKKRLDLLVDGFARVATSDPALHLVIAGPDTEGIGSNVRSQIELLGIGERVSFLGVVTGDMRDSLLAASQMMVLPSENESFGLAVVEAMAAGVPVIVSEGVAVHREVVNAEAGMVAGRNADGLAEAIRSLASPETHKRMSHNARSLVGSTFGLGAMAEGLEDMYGNVIEQNGRRL